MRATHATMTLLGVAGMVYFGTTGNLLLGLFCLVVFVAGTLAISREL